MFHEIVEAHEFMEALKFSGVGLVKNILFTHQAKQLLYCTTEYSACNES